MAKDQKSAQGYDGEKLCCFLKALPVKDFSAGVLRWPAENPDLRLKSWGGEIPVQPDDEFRPNRFLSFIPDLSSKEQLHVVKENPEFPFFVELSLCRMKS